MRRLSLACGDYDRTRPLIDKTVTPLGIDLTCLPMPVEEVFFRMARFREFDVAEMSLSSYLISLQSGPFTAIPVFPSRSFRHSGIYLPANSDVQTPADLVGRTVGVAEYQLTANVWIRGILQDRHGLPVTAVRYRTGGLHEPGRPEKLAITLPSNVDVATIEKHDTLNDMLAEGRIDALYTPRTPKSYTEGRAKRLFPDFKAEEVRYWEATGIFPVMHVVVIRKEIYEQDRWIARSLFDAFEQARCLAYEGMGETAALRYMLPWLAADLEHAQRTLGPDYWTYGVKGNEEALETLIRYAYEQGLIPEPHSTRRLFAPETQERTVI